MISMPINYILKTAVLVFFQIHVVAIASDVVAC